jgi:hypothetical protein
MASRAIKLESLYGGYYYVGSGSVAYMLDKDSYTEIVLTTGAKLNTATDIDDLAEVIWGNRVALPTRQSKKHFPAGTIL